MNMEILKTERKLCFCCMDEHDVATVRVLETNEIKGTVVQYYAKHEYCNLADELYTPEEMISSNDIAMKDAYRKANGLLTSQEICEIRKKYMIRQTDLSLVLGWGGKTITRYEGHQIQDVAHDSILRKIDDDPEWFLGLLDAGKNLLQEQAYRKYRNRAEDVFHQCGEKYLQKKLLAEYSKINGDEALCGGTTLNIPKIVDVIQFFAKSKEVFSLYKVKLMKLLWYADGLSYKRYGHSITGLAYQRLPMGAVPVGHASIMALDGVTYDEIEYGNQQVAYHLIPIEDYRFTQLSEEDMSILNDVIHAFGKDNKDQIVSRMHNERAYIETEERAIIDYQYARDLSIS